MKNIKKRNKLFLLAMFGMVLTLGLIVVGCDDGNNNNNNDGGSGVPAALVGRWYMKAEPGSLIFEITSAKKLLYLGVESHDMSVSGNKVTTSLYGTYTGEFEYSITDGELTVTNAIGYPAANYLHFYSPYIKK
jgi:hypothetical protein